MFDGCSHDEVMFIAHEMRPVLYTPDEIIIYQNDVGEHAYVIAEGKVKIMIKKTVTSDIKDDLNNEVQLKSFVQKKKHNKTMAQLLFRKVAKLS
jgi:hypothetical protein